MARNKRKILNEREKMKGIRIAAKRRWRQWKTSKKALQNAILNEAGKSVSASNQQQQEALLVENVNAVAIEDTATQSGHQLQQEVWPDINRKVPLTKEDKARENPRLSLR